MRFESNVVSLRILIQIYHRFQSHCDQWFHGKAISGSRSKRSVIRCPAVREVGRYSAASRCVKFSFFRIDFPLVVSI